jgi:hypothetical protein
MRLLVDLISQRLEMRFRIAYQDDGINDIGFKPLFLIAVDQHTLFVALGLSCRVTPRFGTH